jgi:hypothetical protein
VLDSLQRLLPGVTQCCLAALVFHPRIDLIPGHHEATFRHPNLEALEFTVEVLDPGLLKPRRRNFTTLTGTGRRPSSEAFSRYPHVSPMLARLRCASSSELTVTLPSRDSLTTCWQPARRP